MSQRLEEILERENPEPFQIGTLTFYPPLEGERAWKTKNYIPYERNGKRIPRFEITRLDDAYLLIARGRLPPISKENLGVSVRIISATLNLPYSLRLTPADEEEQREAQGVFNAFPLLVGSDGYALTLTIYSSDGVTANAYELRRVRAETEEDAKKFFEFAQRFGQAARDIGSIVEEALQQGKSPLEEIRMRHE